jgi:tryptophan-rich sensory protein
MRTLYDILALIAFVGVCLLTGWIGSIVTVPAIDDWYRELAKPSWTPPAWLFGPVWTGLYAMMGVAAWMVWIRRPKRQSVDPAAEETRAPVPDPRRTALALFAIQLALNAAWSWIFFGMRSPGWAAVEISALWIAIACTMTEFFRVSPFAGLLFMPYLGWVTFAAALNFAIWSLNAR